MDNASKALVMAGAILIAVMLISLGVLLFNRGQQTAEQAGHLMDSKAIATYNSTYQMFEGVNRSPSEARTLITQVKAHNANSQESYDYGPITLDTSGKTATSQISNTKKYTIELTAFGGNGAVSTIKITET